VTSEESIDLVSAASGCIRGSRSMQTTKLIVVHNRGPHSHTHISIQYPLITVPADLRAGDRADVKSGKKSL